jgi:hypothetical protein
MLFDFKRHYTYRGDYLVRILNNCLYFIVAWLVNIRRYVEISKIIRVNVDLFSLVVCPKGCQSILFVLVMENWLSCELTEYLVKPSVCIVVDFNRDGISRSDGHIYMKT